MADCLQEKTLQRLCGARSSASRISFSADLIDSARRRIRSSWESDSVKHLVAMRLPSQRPR